MKPAAPWTKPADLLGLEVTFRAANADEHRGSVCARSEGSDVDVDVLTADGATWSVPWVLCSPAPPRRGRPPVDPSGRVSSNQICVRLEPCLFEDVDHMATKAGLTRGAWVRRLIWRQIVGDPPEPAPF